MCYCNWFNYYSDKRDDKRNGSSKSRKKSPDRDKDRDRSKSKDKAIKSESGEYNPGTVDKVSIFSFDKKLKEDQLHSGIQTQHTAGLT